MYVYVYKYVCTRVCVCGSSSSSIICMCVCVCVCMCVCVFTSSSSGGVLSFGAWPLSSSLKSSVLRSLLIKVLKRGIKVLLSSSGGCYPLELAPYQGP
jgi:hypothetical protein